MCHCHVLDTECKFQFMFSNIEFKDCNFQPQKHGGNNHLFSKCKSHIQSHVSIKQTRIKTFGITLFPFIFRTGVVVFKLPTCINVADNAIHEQVN
jgi:hypothetical protein